MGYNFRETPNEYMACDAASGSDYFREPLVIIVSMASYTFIVPRVEDDSLDGR